MTQKTDQIRNIGLVGHSSCGKTSLAEAILYNSKVINRLGKVDDGSSTMDFEPEEIKRKVTLGTSFCPYSWKNKQFNIIDTPGENDFLSDAKICLQAAEGAALIVDAVDGVKVGTDKVWGFSSDYNLPRIIIINKLDRERADFYKVLEDIENNFSIKATPIYLPVGAESEFKGLVNLVRLKAHIYKNDASGSFADEDIPDSMKDIVEKWHERIMENIVEANDDIMEKYLEGQEISTKEVEETLIEGVKSGIIIPIMPCSSILNIGISQLLDNINQFIPFPVERGKASGHKIGSEEKLNLMLQMRLPFRRLSSKLLQIHLQESLICLRSGLEKLLQSPQSLILQRIVKEKLGQLLLIEGKNKDRYMKLLLGILRLLLN